MGKCQVDRSSTAYRSRAKVAAYLVHVDFIARLTEIARSLRARVPTPDDDNLRTLVPRPRAPRRRARRFSHRARAPQPPPGAPPRGGPQRRLRQRHPHRARGIAPRRPPDPMAASLADPDRGRATARRGPETAPRPCPLLAPCPRKHVLCRHYFHIRQSGASNGIQVLPFQESAADSSGPEVDDLFGCVGDRLVDDYVRDIQPAAGLQDSVDLNEAGILIRC